jgi:hypothetical protein
MNDDVTKTETHQTTVMVQKTVPVDGNVVFGANVTTDVNGLVKIAKVSLKKQIRARLEADQKELAACRKACEEALRTRDAAALALPIPEDLYADLEPVARAMMRFAAGATVERVTRSNQPLTVAYANVSFETATYQASGRVVCPVKGELFAGTRGYPLPDAVRRLHDAHVAARAEVARCEANVQADNRELATINETAEDLEAAIYAQGMRTTETGQRAAKAMDEVVSEVMGALDKRRDSKALPPARS